MPARNQAKWVAAALMAALAVLAVLTGATQPATEAAGDAAGTVAGAGSGIDWAAWIAPLAHAAGALAILRRMKATAAAALLVGVFAYFSARYTDILGGNLAGGLVELVLALLAGVFIARTPRRVAAAERPGAGR